MSSGPVRFLLLGLVSVSMAAVTSSAQAPSWSITGPAFEASPADLIAAASKVPAEKFMEATVLFERDAYVIDAEGRLTYSHHMIYRLETQEGVEGWAETRIQWDPWYQNQPDIRARVISIDGKISTLDPKTITDGPAKEESEDTYTDARIRKAPLPGVAIGVLVEEQTTLSDKSPFFSGGGLYRDSFSRDVPIIRAELVIDSPAAVNFQYKVHSLPDAKISSEENAGLRHFTLGQNYLPAHADSDIDLPTHNVSGPNVEFSTGESWASVAAAYRKLAEVNIDPEKVRALLPAPLAGDRTAIIQRIVARLHKEIRYTGIEFGEASLQPAPAAEVVKRHYGDCKDKAAMLVAMLRAAGIPASMALLDTGPGLDVDPALPGMNYFDHAIVYVPAPATGGDPLWIDATAEFGQVGTLPSMDEGRLALIVADGTTALTATPTPKPDDDHLIELRDVALADYGPAHIVETSMTHGEVDANYRSTYGGEETRERKEDLEKYAKNAYLAKALGSIDHGDAHDLFKPFALKLDMTEAKRGNTAIDDAIVGIPFADIFDRLPEWFRTDPKVEGEKLTPQQEENRKRAIAARTTEYDVHPFVTEWQYTIVPPEGFVLRALPEDKTTAIGPATLTQHYVLDPQGAIKGTLRFETSKPRYTVDEALALRDAVLATYKQDIISVWFDQAGSKLIAAGKTREGLASDRELIAKHPSKGLHHAQMSYALLKAGLGDRARAEARKATDLDPKSPVGYRALGWVCQFNEIGIQYAPGFDWKCAHDAFKKASELDPDDNNTAINLAYLDEYDNDGERYSPTAHLADAVAGYRAVKQKEKSVGEEYDDNVFFDLLYGGKNKELLDELAKVQSSTTRSGLAISATVALAGGGAKGIAAGVDRADHLSGGVQERSQALATAGNQLVHMRLYPEAAGILSAAVEGQQDSASVAQQIAVFRQLTPWKGQYLPLTDARSVVQRMFMTFMTGAYSEQTANEILARHAYGSDAEWRRYIEHSEESRGMLHTSAERSGLPAVVLLDVIADNLKMTDDGDDESGHRITLQSLGSKPEQFFVTKDDGVYKIVTGGSTPAESGNEVMYLVHAGRLKEARSLLDWTRDKMHKGGGDDALSGPLLPRFWTVGDPADPAAMQLAAASLLSLNKDAIKDLLPSVEAARQKAATDDAHLSLDLLLGEGYATLEDAAHLKPIAAAILAKYPDSYVALSLGGRLDEMLKDWPAWQLMLDAQLAKHPDDENLLHLKVEFAEASANWVLARATEQQLIDKGKATAGDYNNYGWIGLFDGKLDDDTIKNARQATMLTHNSTFPELHTLACLYAAQGKTAEARDLLLKAMAAGNMSLPNSEVWYGFASIYEQFGVNDAAIEAYRKVEKPEGRIGATSTYLLATTRLKALAP